MLGFGVGRDGGLPPGAREPPSPSGATVPGVRPLRNPKTTLSWGAMLVALPLFGHMKADIHPKYEACEIRCACGNSIETRSTRKQMLVGICNACHPFYTGQQKFVDTAGRVDKFQQRLAKTQAAQAALADAASKKKKRA